jgi:CheY-like chemotaxis protein
VGSILVVEDDLDTCNLLTEALQRAGFHVLVTSSGRHALSLAKAERPDLILLDLRLPRMDGYTVLQLLKVSPSTANIPVMIMTGSVKMDAVREQEFIALGAASFVAKPFQVETLIAQIESVLAAARDPERHG